MNLMRPAMKHIPILLLLWLLTPSVTAAPRTIHVFVALCDNVNQGIVPVPEKIGNGQLPASNLYWGAGYGVKNFFSKKSPDWQLVQTLPVPSTVILERLLFKHKTEDVYLLADAYDGAEIKSCIEDLLLACNGQNTVELDQSGALLRFGGSSNLLAYIGHDGLMEFSVDLSYSKPPTSPREVIILACYSKRFFGPEVLKSGATPLLWTTHLMAPEAYTLEEAIRGWIKKETATQIDERAAVVYDKYQKCGLKGARNLFTSGH